MIRNADKYSSLWVARADLLRSEEWNIIKLSIENKSDRRFFEMGPSDLMPLKNSVLDWFLENMPTVKIDMRSYYGYAYIYFDREEDIVQFKLSVN